MCLLAALVRGGARTRVTHAALTFTGSPETATMVTSILRWAIRGWNWGQSAQDGEGWRAQIRLIVVAF